MIYYHGSSIKFNKFKYKNRTAYGNGFYFTVDKEYAKFYLPKNFYDENNNKINIEYIKTNFENGKYVEYILKNSNPYLKTIQDFLNEDLKLLNYYKQQNKNINNNLLSKLKNIFFKNNNTLLFFIKEIENRILFYKELLKKNIEFKHEGYIYEINIDNKYSFVNYENKLTNKEKIQKLSKFCNKDISNYKFKDIYKILEEKYPDNYLNILINIINIDYIKYEFSDDNNKLYKNICILNDKIIKIKKIYNIKNAQTFNSNLNLDF